MTCILEHSFKARDEKRTYLCLKPKIAPTKVSILPLQADAKFDPVISRISIDILIQDLFSKENS